ncbi:MAG: DUF742 domain-containing protein [Streptomycetaceae bacterium]|nr:DUF742 domain-containing protein [Streptomycetaceae bacterium]
MECADGASWSVEDSTQVRPYAVTSGRTQPRHLLSLESVLEAGSAEPAGTASPEAAQILALCRSHRRSIAELSGTIGQPVPVVKVLVSDLLDARALWLPVTTPFYDSPTGPRPHTQLLEAVSAGLRNLWPDAASKAV